MTRYGPWAANSMGIMSGFFPVKCCSFLRLFITSEANTVKPWDGLLLTVHQALLEEKVIIIIILELRLCRVLFLNALVGFTVVDFLVFQNFGTKTKPTPPVAGLRPAVLTGSRLASIVSSYGLYDKMSTGELRMPSLFDLTKSGESLAFDSGSKKHQAA